jgi:hypothetical protein
MFTPDTWAALLALAVIVLPLILAWLLLGWVERRRSSRAARGPGRR